MMSRVLVTRISAVPVSRLAVAATILAAAVSPLYLSPFANYRLSLVLLYAVAGLGLHLLIGMTGQISLGHGAFVALGAYAAAIGTREFNVNYLLVLVVAGPLGWCMGWLIGRPALRLHGMGLALVTLGLALVTPSIIKRTDDWTQGQEGIVVAAGDPPQWVSLERDQWIYYVCLTCVLVATVVAARLSSGPAGRALTGIRQHPTATQTLGVDTQALRSRVFSTSAAMATVAGVLYAYVVQFVSPDVFGLTLAIALITLVVVGGLGSTLGVFLGAAFIVYLPDYAARFNPSAPDLSYGLALTLGLLFLPTGFAGVIKAVVKSTRLPGRPPGGFQRKQKRNEGDEESRLSRRGAESLPIARADL